MGKSRLIKLQYEVYKLMAEFDSLDLIFPMPNAVIYHRVPRYWLRAKVWLVNGRYIQSAELWPEDLFPNLTIREELR